ncbi:receptor expression-enhancing protein 1-like isoform X2 [Watersipora subatra]|uniref:receptor expression-enhancing protein 1-like isoform X2 n=1 Tax=Watersipora subatra TaxID=2589382 RepID=UPI00355AFF2C
MVSALISKVVILVFGTLYPAYSSYKAVKNKDVKEYVKWMMYWIVFALFTSVETFADVLVSWFPFYYELKIIFVIWLLSPVTKGSSVLYRKCVHPELLKREAEIDQTLEKVKTQGYTALVNAGQQGINFAVQSAVTGQNKVMDHLVKKSFSLGDLSRQQPDNTPVSYKPSTERIVEDRDEPDYSSHIPERDPPRVPNLIHAELQGGQGYAPPPTAQAHGFNNAPVGIQDGANPMHANQPGRGYELRSHEYHGEAVRPPNPQHYHHTEGYHLGTLPRRSASKRSKTNDALPSRWAKPVT